MPTERIYYRDAYQVAFEASVISQSAAENGVRVILDRTCFYPAGGGQPPDSGEIDGQPVLDVYEDGDAVAHLLPAAVAGPRVAGRVDWARRFDHMQQHTGQHILSAAFEKAAGVPTIAGFHLGAEVSTIDLDRSELSRDEADRAEDLANRVVLENRPVTARLYASAAEIEDPALRGATGLAQNIRIVEVAGFDACPCGGTHVRATGEVGPIAVIGWERRRDTVRVRFLCGGRALADYRHKSETVRRLAEQFTVGEPEIVDAVARLAVEYDVARRQLVELKDRLLDMEATDLAARARETEIRVIQQAFAGRDVQDVRGLAQRIITNDRTVALLGVASEPAQIIFARSADLTADVGRLLADTCRAFGGRGGGRPHWAQGGGFPASRLDEALAWARQQLEIPR